MHSASYISRGPLTPLQLTENRVIHSGQQREHTNRRNNILPNDDCAYKPTVISLVKEKKTPTAYATD